MNVAKKWAEVGTDAEVVLYRLVRDGYRLRISEEGKLKVGRYDGKRKPLPDGLRQSVTKHKEEIISLTSPLPEGNTDREWNAVMVGISEEYPAGVGCDLTPAIDILSKAQGAAERGDWAGYRYAMHVGCKKALAICREYQGKNPIAVQEAIS